MEQTQDYGIDRTSESLANSLGQTPAQIKAHITRLFYSNPPILILSLSELGADNTLSQVTASYRERVTTIDRIFSARQRVYIVVDAHTEHSPSITKQGENVWRLRMRDWDQLGKAAVEALLDLGGGVYIHTAAALASSSLRKLLNNRGSRIVLDLHDCDDGLSDLFDSSIDRDIAFLSALDALIYAKPSTLKRFSSQFKPPLDICVEYQIYVETTSTNISTRHVDGRPQIIWVAGASTDELHLALKAISVSCHFADWVLVTHDVERTKRQVRLYEPKVDLASLVIRPYSRAILIENYRRCDYALVHSKNSTELACKLTEFAAAGIVSIVDPQVADFEGSDFAQISTVRLQDALAGSWPTPNQWKAMALHNLSIFRKSHSGRLAIAKVLDLHRVSFKKLSVLDEKGFLVLADYSGSPIPKEEWQSLKYLNWRSGGDTNFAPIASAYGAMECAGFWDHGKADKDGIWTENAKLCPSLVKWTKSVGANYGRVRVVKLNPSSEEEAIRNLHRDNNNALNQSGAGWVVRIWLQLSHDPHSLMILRENKGDLVTENRISLPRGRQIIVDSQRLYHAVWHGGNEPRYALIASFESGDDLRKWIEANASS
jgi:hypothetical protein